MWNHPPATKKPRPDLTDAIISANMWRAIEHRPLIPLQTNEDSHRPEGTLDGATSIGQTLGSNMNSLDLVNLGETPDDIVPTTCESTDANLPADQSEAGALAVWINLKREILASYEVRIDGFGKIYEQCRKYPTVFSFDVPKWCDAGMRQRHADAVIQNVIGQPGKLAVFKFGITVDPHNRWLSKEMGYAWDKDFTHMFIVGICKTNEPAAEK